MKTLERTFDKKREVTYPKTKIILALFKGPKQQPGDTPRQVTECIEKAMESVGVGTLKRFDLTWELLLTTLTINGLPTYQDKILGNCPLWSSQKENSQLSLTQKQCK